MLDETKQNILAKLIPKGFDTAFAEHFREKIEQQQLDLTQINTIAAHQTPLKLSQQELEKFQILLKNYLQTIEVQRSGIAKLDPEYFFENAEQNLLLSQHRVVLIIAEKMDYEKMKDAPSQAAAHEIIRTYCEIGEKVVLITKYLNKLGIPAIGHHPLGNINQYHQILLPPHAQSAGMGEQGRTGLFIDYKLGSLVRLAGVSLPFPLETGQRKTRGINAFCHRCSLCAVSCPVSAIPKTNYIDSLKQNITIEFKVNGTRCMQYFAEHFGCSKCLVSCPFAQPSNKAIEKRIVRTEQWYNKWIVSKRMQTEYEKAGII